MNRIKYIQILVFSMSIFMAFNTFGQKDKLSVYGSGRFVLQNNSRTGQLFEQTVLNADTIAPDTVNTRREIGGMALFDLGFHFKPNSNTEVKVLTRVTGDLDGFWGAGIGFNFREMYVRGLFKNIIRYRVGDLDLKMTPFTLYNSDPDLRSHSLSSLNVYRDIIEYENFHTDNRWRQQGAQVELKLNVGKKDELDINGHITKNRHTDYFFVPDRVMAGGQAIFHKKGLGRFGYQINSFFELAKTAQFADGARATTVQSLTAEVSPLKNSNQVFYGELGLSHQGYSEIDNAPESDADLAFNAGVRLPIDDGKWGWYAEFMHVASGFRSPGAQSRRLNPTAATSNLTYYSNQELQRPISVFDIVQDATIYNNTIQMGLSSYNPAFSNAQPYGKATPNRQGLLLGLARSNDSLMVTKVALDGGYLTEISGRGINEFRNFTFIDLSAQVDLKQLFAANKSTLIDAHVKFENTSRKGLQEDNPAIAGIGKINLSSALVEIGLSQEISGGLYADVGVLMFNANGNEFTALHNEFTEVIDYVSADHDYSDLTFMGGLRYEFSANSTFLAQVRNSSIDNALVEQYNYKWNQFVLVYNLFF